MKTRLMNLPFMLLFFMTSCSSFKTTPETINETTRKVVSKNFTVVVNYAHPLRMKPVYLTSEYDLRIKNDSAFAFLPYYGVAQIAPYNPSEGGIKFAEPMENYRMTPNKKKDGWNIQFRIKQTTMNYEVSMDVFNNGTASFQVSSYDRDPISFNGEVKK